MKIRKIQAILMMMGVLFIAESVHANGIPWPRRHWRRPIIHRTHPLQLKYHRVNVAINNGVAVTKVDEAYYNPNRRQFEGSFIYPLPGDAVVTRFAMSVNGKMQKGELLDANKARGIYTRIVRSLKDPGLLEYMGTKAFRLRIFPVPARGTKRVQIEYTRILRGTGGLFSYINPLGTDRFTSHPPKQVTFNVVLKSRLPIKTVYCPTHKVQIIRKSDHEVKVSYETSNYAPKKDFRLFYAVSRKSFGMSIMTYRVKGEDGYFMALLAPKQKISRKDIVKKDVVFVLDRSGSMQGQKMEQAKKALRFCVNALSRGDRFNIVPFSTESENWKERLVDVSPETIRLARKYIGKLDASGGTDINGALSSALAMKPSNSKRPFMVIFLTDGEPTVGVISTEQILKNMKKRNRKGTRLFVLGIGNQLNTKLLDKLAEENRGDRSYISESENMEVKISNFYSKIAYPVLANLKLKFKGLKAYDIYPKKLPDLFRGSQLVVMGRYKNPGMKSARLSGVINGEKHLFTYESAFAADNQKHMFLPRTWASRKIGYLLDNIRLNGMKPELKKEVARLAKKYGIITPYTSYLVLEDVRRRPRSFTNRVLGGTIAPRRWGRSAEKSFSDMGASGGAGAVSASTGVRAMKKMETASEATGAYARDSQGRRAIKTAGDKTFYRNGTVWTDSTYKGKGRKVSVAYLSDKYFKLLERHKILAKYFAVGEQVVVVYKGVVYKVTPAEE